MLSADAGAVASLHAAAPRAAAASAAARVVRDDISARRLEMRGVSAAGRAAGAPRRAHRAGHASRRAPLRRRAPPAAAASATAAADQPATAAELARLVSIPYERFTLPNGLRVERRLIFYRRFVKHSEFEEFKRFYRELLNGDGGMVVVRSL